MTFQSWTVSSFRVKNREILVAQFRYRAYYPKTTRFPKTPRVSSSALPLASFYRLSHSMCAENYFTSALARLPRQWALKIFIFWARGSSNRAVDLKGDRLISLRGDNGPYGMPGFDFEVKRPRCHVLDPSRFLPTSSSSCFSGNGEEI